MQLFRNVWSLLVKTIPTFLSVYLIIYSSLYFDVLGQGLINLQLQNREQYFNQVAEYNAMIEIQATNMLMTYALKNGLDEAKKEALDRDDKLFQIIAGVEKDNKAIVNKVNDKFLQPTYEYLKSITVYLVKQSKTEKDQGWIGTGVILSLGKDSTYILTNHHVMDNDTENYDYYVIEDTKKYPVTALKVSAEEAVDLSLVKIDGFIDGKRPVVGFGKVKVQDKVFMVGHNLGRAFFYSEGFVAGFDKRSNNELVVGMPSGPGNSGSGVINQRGELVGLLFAGSVVGEFPIMSLDMTHGLCMPIEVIKLFLAGYLNG